MTNSGNRKSSKEPKQKVNGINDMTRSFKLRPCSCSRRRRICTPFLPKEIIFKVLLCLPAEILYNVMRFVCWEWYNIIKDPTFINAHLQRSSEGVLMQITNEGNYTQYAELGKDGVKIAYLNLPPGVVKNGMDFGWFEPPNSGWSIPFLRSRPRVSEASPHFPAGAICGSCNGLVLIVDLRCYGIHVANLILKHWISLPPADMNGGYYGKVGIAYATTSRKFKVAHVCTNANRYAFEIVTVGVDTAWRYLGYVDELSCIQAEVNVRGCFNYDPPKTTAGFIHWVSDPNVLSLDVEKESFHFNVARFGPRDKYKYRKILTTESYLFFMLSRDEQIWEQWALTEVETGTWLKLRTISVSAQIGMIQSRLLTREFHMGPICLQKNGDLVCFLCCGVNRIDNRKTYFFYDVKTGRSEYFDHGGLLLASPFFYRHKKSLISVGNDARGPEIRLH